MASAAAPIARSTPKAETRELIVKRRENTMKSIATVVTAATLAVSLAAGGAAQAAPPCCQPTPLVSTGWLAANRGAPGLIVVDVRTTAEYAAGHIPGSVNIPVDDPASIWVTTRDELLLELPDTEDLFAGLGAFGIRRSSRVVIVTSAAEPPYPQARANRAAITLVYAGVRTVSILDGGYPKWVAEHRATTDVVPTVTPTTFTGTVNGAGFVDTAYVEQRLGHTVLIDARDAAVYAGTVTEPWALKPGHIATAVSMPAPQIWNADGTYKSTPELAAIVRNAIGTVSPDSEIIVYCGVGGYASSWSYVLAHVLRYRNVKMYDGSAQEWVRDHDMVM